MAQGRRGGSDRRLHRALDSLLILPGEDARIGRAQIGPQLQRTLGGARDLHASIVDFASTGELAYAYGRYFCACRPAPQGDELGHYVAVVKVDGDEWRIRALAMWVDPSETQPQ